MMRVHELPSTYEGWIKTLNGKVTRMVAHNTLAEDMGNYVRVQYHYTTIARIYPDNCVWINTGGYRTSTTKTRLNIILGARENIYQKNWEWYWSDGEHYEDETIVTKNGMRIDVSNHL